MSTLLEYGFAFLVWPGILVAAPLGWFYLWYVRKLIARLQGRKGPPFFQPFFDFMKLMGKRTVIPAGVSRSLFLALPLIALAAVSAALAIVPVPGNTLPSLPGDVVLLLYLLEVPVLCEVLAGYVTRSVYGQVSAMREALMSLAYNVPFIAAVIALAWHAGSFDLRTLAAQPFSVVHVFAAVAFVMALPARMKTNPFSIPNAEHEIVADAHIEYNGPALGLFKLAGALEIVELIEVFAILFVPALPWSAGTAVLYFVVGLVLMGAITVLANITARLRLTQAFRFYWTWGGAASAVALVAALVW